MDDVDDDNGDAVACVDVDDDDDDDNIAAAVDNNDDDATAVTVDDDSDTEECIDEDDSGSGGTFLAELPRYLILYITTRSLDLKFQVRIHITSVGMWVGANSFIY